MNFIPTDVVTSIILEVDDPDSIHSLSCCSTGMRIMATDPKVRALWLHRHHSKDAIEILARKFYPMMDFDNYAEVLMHLVDLMWKEQEDRCDKRRNMTILHYACYFKLWGVAKKSLDLGCRFDMRCPVPYIFCQAKRMYTPLQLACLSDCGGIVKLLLEHAKGCGHRWDRGEYRAAIADACSLDNIEVIKILLEAGRKVDTVQKHFVEVSSTWYRNIEDNDYDSDNDFDYIEEYNPHIPIETAVDVGKEITVTMLLDGMAKVGADLVCTDGSFERCIRTACIGARSGVIEAFIKHGVTAEAMSDMRGEWGLSPLHIACKYQNREVIRTLLRSGFDIEHRVDYHYLIPSGENFTALHIAVLHRDAKTVELLLQHGANPRSVATYIGDVCPIDLAENSPKYLLNALETNTHIIELLNEYGA